MDGDIFCDLLYFIRRKSTGSVRSTLATLSKKSTLQECLLFSSLVHLVEDQYQEAIRIFQQLRNDRDFGLAALIGLSVAYRNKPTLDISKAEELDATVKTLRRTANGYALFYAGICLYALNRFEKAKEFAEKALKHENNLEKAKSLIGWSSCYCSNKDIQRTAEYFFGTESQNDVCENLFGLAICAEVTGDLPESLRLMNSTIMRFPSFLPALTEKIEILLSSDQWEQALDAASRCIDINPRCVLSTTFKLMHSIGRGFNYMQSGRHSQLLKKARQFIFRALESSADHESTHIIAADIHLALGNIKEALQHFKKAMSIDQTSVETINGMIHCQLLQGLNKDAALQLELLGELAPTIEITGETVYLQALLTREQGGKTHAILGLLDKATDLHFKSLSNLQHNMEYFIKLNPDFLLQLVNAYLALSKQPVAILTEAERSANGSNATLAIFPDEEHVLNKAQTILTQVLTSMPGLQKANYFLACVHLRQGNEAEALKYSQIALDIDPTCIDAHVQQAQVYLSQSNLRMAEQALEIGLSNNFDMRDHPLNHLVRAKLYLNEQNIEKAIRILNETLANPDAPGKSSIPVSKSLYSEFWITIFLELVYSYRKLGKNRNAEKILAEAQAIYAGTPEVDRLSIAAADIALSDGKLEAALAQLRTITADSHGFILAKQRMADIYLNHRKSTKLFIACYREVAETLDGCAFAHLLLGDAYMRVQQPERAIEVYESVLRWNPGDLRLASKMGEALVTTYDFEKAVVYYESAVRGAPMGTSPLQTDLAVLLIKLKKFEKAETMLTVGVERLKLSMDVPDLQHMTDLLLLLSLVYKLQERFIDELSILEKAAKAIETLLKHINIEDSPDVNKACRRMLASIYIQEASTHQQLYFTIREAPDDVSQPHQKPSTASNGLQPPRAFLLLEGGGGDESTATTSLAAGRETALLELHKSINSCELAIRSVTAIHPTETRDRVKHAAALSLLARCHLALRNRAECEQSSLRLALLQEELQSSQPKGMPTDYKVSTELFSPPLAEKNTSAHMGTYPLTRCAGAVEFVSAAIVMADLLTQECDFNGAIPHLQKHLCENSEDYAATFRLITTYRRIGNLPLAIEYLKRLQEGNPAVTRNYGFNFALGLYHWYVGDSTLAIKHFNQARLDPQYEAQSLTAMIENCLSITFRGIGTSTLLDSIASTTSLQGGSGGGGPVGPSSIETNELKGISSVEDVARGCGFGDATLTQLAAYDTNSVESTGYETAGYLLTKLSKCKELSHRPNLYRFWHNLHLAVSRDKTKVEKALHEFAEMNDECENVSAIFGAAVCFVLLQQEQKAKNQLKRLAKHTWSPDDDWCLEKAWLLLAEIYMGLDKRDMALELLKRCIQHNQSCYQAYELMGTIMEKNTLPEEAAKNFSSAWDILNRQDPSVGYKLASSYLKSKDYFHAVDVCHEVLQVSPNYPFIRTTVMQRALEALRA